MIYIAHRGNTNGPDKEKENTIGYILDAVNKGYDVEIDIRYIDGKYYLGHDFPQEITPLKFLKLEQMWCHAKDGTTLRRALKDGLHVFFDKSPEMNYTLTSKGFIWHWDGEGLIYVMDQDGLYGMCSDYIERL